MYIGVVRAQRTNYAFAEIYTRFLASKNRYYNTKILQKILFKKKKRKSSPHLLFKLRSNYFFSVNFSSKCHASS